MENWHFINEIIFIIIILPSVTYNPEGFQKLDRMQNASTCFSWNDLPPRQQSSRVTKLR